MNLLAASIDSDVGLTREGLADMNAQYKPLHFAERIKRIYKDFDADKVMVTSSFAATSAYFLHIISNIRPEQVIFFIDTGFHFPQTLEYKDYLVDFFKLKVEAIKADKHFHNYSVEERLFEKDPDFCCSINKINPLEEIKPNYDVWISSLMGWQTDHRAGLDVFEVRNGIIKFNPMIDVTRRERDDYIQANNLPFHPLVAEGYASIGCSHCTVKGDGRSGRWQGKPKTECGLHL